MIVITIRNVVILSYEPFLPSGRLIHNNQSLLMTSNLQTCNWLHVTTHYVADFDVFLCGESKYKTSAAVFQSLGMTYLVL